jgi:hypothetical protein
MRRAAQLKEFVDLEWALAEAEAAGYGGTGMGTGHWARLVLERKKG